MSNSWVTPRRSKGAFVSSRPGARYMISPQVSWATWRSRCPLRRPLVPYCLCACTTGVAYSIRIIIISPWVSVATSTGLSVSERRCALLHTLRPASLRSRATSTMTTSQVCRFVGVGTSIWRELQPIVVVHIEDSTLVCANILTGDTRTLTRLSLSSSIRTKRSW